MLRIGAISACAFVVAILARRSEGSWSAPAVVFATMWAGYLLSAVFFVMDAEQLINGMLWVWLNTLVFYLGTVVFHPYGTAGRDPEHAALEATDRGAPLLRLCVSAAVGFGVLGVFEALFARGFSARDVLSFAVLSQVSSKAHSDLYSGIDTTSLARRVLFIVMFFGALCGGVLARSSRRRAWQVFGLAPLGVIAFLYTLYGSRMGVLFGGSFWLGAYLATHVYLTGGSRRGDRVLFGLGGAAAGVMLGLSTLTMVVRYVASGELNWRRMLADPFSFIAAFGIWFDRVGFHASGLLLGGRTFRRPFELIGISFELPPEIDVGFTSSNIYTVFRDLLEDFGSVGALLVVFGVGALARKVYAATSRGEPGAVPWLTLVYALAITSFANGALSYTTPMLALALFIGSFRWVAGLKGAALANGPVASKPPIVPAAARQAVVS